MKIIVGLGNPGKKYRGTRHNVGFEVISALHQQNQSPRPTAKFNSEIVEIRVDDEKVLLQSPLTYMNLSGQAVRAAMDYYQLLPTDLFVVCDDFNLPLGRLRIKPSGSAGGQNGLRDIIVRLGTPEFTRLRIGIGRPAGDRDPSNWVLGRFATDEIPEIEPAIQKAAEATIVWVRQGVQPCMNQFNVDLSRPRLEPDPEGKPPTAGRDPGPQKAPPEVADNRDNPAGND